MLKLHSLLDACLAFDTSVQNYKKKRHYLLPASSYANTTTTRAPNKISIMTCGPRRAAGTWLVWLHSLTLVVSCRRCMRALPRFPINHVPGLMNQSINHAGLTWWVASHVNKDGRHKGRQPAECWLTSSSEKPKRKPCMELANQQASLSHGDGSTTVPVIKRRRPAAVGRLLNFVTT